MKLPTIITNFKTYESATGDEALKLAKIHEKVAKEMGMSIAVAVQTADISRVASEVDIPIFAQHIDPVGFGSYTGHILPETVKQAGAFGTLLNHSEHRLDREVLKDAISRAKEVGLYVVCCAEDPQEGKELLEFGPDLVAVEPPELIGGDISVCSASPDVIKGAVNLIGDKVLVGAGVKNAEDVRVALKLGAKGVLLASGITKAEDPEEVLKDLAKGLG